MATNLEIASFDPAPHSPRFSLLAKYKAFESAVETHLPPKTLAVIRLDGKAFHTFTKHFARPFDAHFAATMDAVGAHLCDVVDGALFAYVQSDEISVVFSDLANPGTQMWAGGRVQKMVSIAAANATAKYMTVSPTALFPIFDARVHTLESLDEAREYIVWRRSDATKNAITMAANTLHSHKALMGLTTSDRRELLRGTEHESLPDEFLNGRLIVKEYRTETVTYTDRRTNLLHSTVVNRGRWVSRTATDEALEYAITPVGNV
jgi:tRNA(His) guanylyltransferase